MMLRTFFNIYKDASFLSPAGVSRCKMCVVMMISNSDLKKTLGCERGVCSERETLELSGVWELFCERNFRGS